jgi:hypothetical protein
MTASTMLGERFLDAMGEFAQDFEDPEASLALIESLLEDTAECPSVEIAVAKPDRRDLSMTTFLIDTRQWRGHDGRADPRRHRRARPRASA